MVEQTDASRRYRFGGRFELNAVTRELLVDGAPAALGARAFEVLLALVERRDRVVTKDELLELVWPGLVVEENNLQVQISTLRKLLGTQAIATVPARGYQFSLAATAVVPNDVLSPQPPHDLRVIGALGIGTLIVAAGVAWWLKPAVIEPQNVDPKSVAVLPFANISEDKNNAHFADGVQEDLLSHLAQLGDLKVVSRTSVAEYRDTKKKLRQIGAELGVGSIIEGSVRRSGDRVRVTAQLIDVRTDRHVWSNTYDRELKDIFAIQSDIAKQIARALEVALTPTEQNRLARKPTENLVAYELFVRHKQLQDQAAIGTTATYGVGLPERIKLLERAVELDPNFAVAWARLGGELVLVHFIGARGSSRPADANPMHLVRAKQAIDRAVALAPNDIDVGLEVAGFHFLAERDLGRAAQYLENLLRVTPNHVDTTMMLSYVRMDQGRFIEANELLERLLAIDSRNYQALVSRRDLLSHFRQLDAMWSMQQRLTEIRPTDVDARCGLHEIEYYRTGSFAAYDAWRATLPAGIERTSENVRRADGRRARARRDWDALLRLIDLAQPDALADGQGARIQSDRMIILLAKGERSQALDSARAMLPRAAEEWKRQPINMTFAATTIHAKALLGDRSGALDDLRRLRESSEYRRDHNFAGSVLALEAGTYALLGEREQALEAVATSLKRGAFPSLWRVHVPVFSLWDDPAFQALLSDPAHNAPLPITNLAVGKKT